MSKMHSNSQWMIGVIEDIEVFDLNPPLHQLRSNLDPVNELADSIKQKGLLQPIVARIKNSNSYEIVAGWRRFNACKTLGWRKIPCHVVDLSDKEALEISLIENIQRNSLSVMEEARAFKNYVDRYGWGGASDLATKLGKSVSYVTKRIQLLDLPLNVIKSVTDSIISPSIAEELCIVKDLQKQSNLAERITEKKLSVRKSRELIKSEVCRSDEIETFQSQRTTREIRLVKRMKLLDKTIILMRITMNRFGGYIEDSEEDKPLHDVLMKHKNLLHEQIDNLLKEKKTLSKSHN